MLTVLLIEDDPINSVLLKMILEEANYFPLVANSLKDAQMVLSNHQPDIILSDVRLPDGLSVDFFSNNLPNCPIIFVTSFPDVDWLETITKIPFSVFYVKPFHPLTLVASLRTSYENFIKYGKVDNDNYNMSIKVPIHYGQTTEIPLSSIKWIEVEGNYITIFLGDKKYVHRSSFRKLLPLLNNRFIQIHHSYIVNISYITKINLSEMMVFIGDKPLKIGRTFRKNVIEQVKNT